MKTTTNLNLHLIKLMNDKNRNKNEYLIVKMFE